MVKSNNKGFSLVEVIIAVAVFAILVGPITSSLISALNIGTTSTKKQYAVETAEEILEGFKTVDLSSGSISFLKNDEGDMYDFGSGTKQASRTVKLGYWSTPATTGTKSFAELAGAPEVTATTTVYTSSDVAIGTNYEKYSCNVDVDDIAYQVFKAGYVFVEYADTAKTQAIVKMDGSTPVQTNVTSTGVIRNLDSDSAAIIVSATYNENAQSNNLDNMAYQKFLEAKKQLVMDNASTYPVLKRQLDAQINIFSEDEFQKQTTIKLSKTASGKYKVTCSVKYTDTTKTAAIRTAYSSSGDSVYEPEIPNMSGAGVVYEQEFENVLPPIYFIYVPAICNGKYCSTDTIVIDDSELGGDASIYMLETAADVTSASSAYKKIIADEMQTKKADTNLSYDNIINDVSELIYENKEYIVKMQNVQVAVKHIAPSAATAGNTTVYTNFTVDTASSDITCQTLDADESGDTYMYALTVNVTAKEGNGTKTIVTGTRGK